MVTCEDEERKCTLCETYNCFMDLYGNYFVHMTDQHSNKTQQKHSRICLNGVKFTKWRFNEIKIMIIQCCFNIFCFTANLYNCVGYIGVEGQMNSTFLVDEFSITFLYVSSSDLFSEK